MEFSPTSKEPLIPTQTLKLTSPIPIQDARAALVVAHPGHELCVHGWLGLARPCVFVLTDGSGRSGRSRLQSTTEILSGVGAKPGDIYGRLPDQAIYAALLSHSFDPLIRLVEELASAFLREGVTYVVGDAVEGYNPTHDACRLMIGAAVEMTNRAGGRPVANFDFSLMGRQDCSDHPDDGAIRLDLDESAFERKIAAMQAYPELAAEVEAGLSGTMLETLRPFPELAAEVEAALSGVNINSFRTECLRPVENRAGSDGLPQEPPFYERYGEKQVALGHYQHVLRYREHVLPFAEALWGWLGDRH